MEDNVRLKSEREVASCSGAPEDERRAIARELHDTLAQCTSACAHWPAPLPAKPRSTSRAFVAFIVAVTGEMQDGVKAILYCLRLALEHDLGTDIAQACTRWELLHPHIALNCRMGHRHHAASILTRPRAVMGKSVNGQRSVKPEQ